MHINRAGLLALIVAASVYLGVGLEGLSAAPIVVDVDPDVVVANGGSTTISSGAVPDILFPEVEVFNRNFEDEWSVRAGTDNANGAFESTSNPYRARRFEAGQTIQLADPTINPIFIQQLWIDNPAVLTDWTEMQPTGFVGLSLAGSAGNYAAWIEVTVDPANNGMPVISSYGYESTPNSDLVIAPEPTSILLALLGVLVLRIRRPWTRTYGPARECHH